ncbi:MAG TPA: DUF4403 family protein [Polyangiaceae bacterium]|nr:DUF4403 family protein [Polyangiaceae bacterium]
MSNVIGRTRTFRLLPHFSAALLLASLAGGCTIHSTTYNYGTASAADAKDKPKADKPKATPAKPKPTPAKPTPAKPTPAKPTPSKPADPKPADPPAGGGGTPNSPPPAPEVSRLVVPVRVPFETLIEKLDLLLPKTQSQDYKRVTKEGASPQVDVKYKAWRDPISATFQGDTLRITVPIRYAANVRAKMKNPVGSDWITVADNQTWGTAANPQRMKFVVELKLEVTKDWTIKSVSKLGDVSHGKPPGGNFCGKVGIDICTPKADIAPLVREHLNDYLIPKIKDGLKRADSELTKAFDPKKHAQSLWTALQTPQQLQKANDKSCPTLAGAACSQAAWLVMTPTSLGLSNILLEDDDIGLDFSLEGKIATSLGDKPKVKVQPLPPRSAPVGPSMFQVRTSLEVPLSVFGQKVQEALSGEEFAAGSSKLAVRKVQLSAASAKELTLTVETSGARELTLKAKAKLSYDAKQSRLGLSSVELDDASKALLKKELPQLDVAALEKRVVAAASLDLSKQSTSLRRAISSGLDGSLPGKLEVKGTLSDVSLVDLAVKGELLTLRLELDGSLAIAYSP